jgi:hypothetical protein
MTNQVKIECSLSLIEDQPEDGLNIGGWSIQENLLYAIFVKQHTTTLVSKKKKK